MSELEVTKISELAQAIREAHKISSGMRAALEIAHKQLEAARDNLSASYAVENELHAALMKVINADSAASLSSKGDAS